MEASALSACYLTSLEYGCGSEETSPNFEKLIVIASVLYTGAGRGSIVAAWKQAARVEIDRATGARYAQILLDLVKAFERIPYRVLLRDALRFGYPLRLLRLAIAVLQNAPSDQGG